MIFSKLNNAELEESFTLAVKSERKIMHVVILHVQEISKRKFYLEKGFSCLFEYLVIEQKYSAASAQRRIEAARLLNDVPTVSAKLESGEINLSQIAHIQSAIKDAEKIHQVKVSEDVKADLVSMVLNHTVSETQQICAEALEIPEVEAPKCKTQQDESTRVEFTFTKEQFEKYEIIRDLLAHKNMQAKRSQRINDVLETLFDMVIAQSHAAERQPKSIKAAWDSEKKVGEVISASKIKPSAENTNWYSLTPKRKKVILAKDRCCQYENPETGRVCGSTFNLQVDHIVPRCVGGSNRPSNLRVLCRAHNLYRAKGH